MTVARLVVLAGMLLMAGVDGWAETVAWYRFGDGMGRTTQMMVLTNLVDSSLYPAHPAVFRNDTATISYEDELMPVVTNAIPAENGLEIYDPVGGNLAHDFVRSSSALGRQWLQGERGRVDRG